MLKKEENVTIYAFDDDGHFFLEYRIAVPRNVTTTDVVLIVKERRDEFPAMDLVIARTDNPRNPNIIPRLIRNRQKFRL